MPIYLLEEYDMLATNEKFVKRVKMGFVHVAKEVLEEPPATPGHLLRAGFARSIIMTSLAENPWVAVIAADLAVIDSAVARWTSTTAANRTPDTAQDGVTNEQILSAIRNLWNPFSGNTEVTEPTSPTT